VTDRPRAVIGQTADLLPVQSSWDQLSTSVSTVKTHVEHVLHKLGSPSRAGAVGTASDHLLLSWSQLD
jgi:DNA-binding CsgD family transcriptional regulator